MHITQDNVVGSLKECQTIWMAQAIYHIDYYSYSQDLVSKGATMPCCVPAERYCDAHVENNRRLPCIQGAKQDRRVHLDKGHATAVTLSVGIFKGYVSAEAVPKDERPGQL